jgi:sec-independent protein translocase protein TatA
MLALFGNLSFSEILLIAVVAVMVFGKRLPEVAGQTVRQVAKLRRNLDDLRRESGIDRELRDVSGALRSLSRDMTAPPPAYTGRPIAREEPRTVVAEPPLAPPIAPPPPLAPPGPAPQTASASEDDPPPAAS